MKKKQKYKERWRNGKTKGKETQKRQKRTIQKEEKTNKLIKRRNIRNEKN